MEVEEVPQLIVASSPVTSVQGVFLTNGTYSVGRERTEDNAVAAILPLDDQWSAAVIQRVVTLCVIIIMTLAGNAIILAALTCSRYRVRTGRTSGRVNIFILNLAVGDLTVCVVTMSTELMVAVCGGEWVLGAAACKMVLYGQIVALASTIFILLAMSYDRYLAICQPLRFKSSVSRARRTIAMAWALALVIALPQIFIFLQVQVGVRPDGNPVYSCKSRGYTAWWQRKVYFSSLTVLILVLPTAIISFCYVNIVRVVWQQGKQLLATPSPTSTTSNASTPGCVSLRKSNWPNDKQMSRAKLRTIKLTLCIIVAFVACWTPYFVVHNLRVHSHYQFHVPEEVMAFAETIALFNSALNPIVYGCFNLRVKKALGDSCANCLGRRGLEEQHRGNRRGRKAGNRGAKGPTACRKVPFGRHKRLERFASATSGSAVASFRSGAGVNYTLTSDCSSATCYYAVEETLIQTNTTAIPSGRLETENEDRSADSLVAQQVLLTACNNAPEMVDSLQNDRKMALQEKDSTRNCTQVFELKEMGAANHHPIPSHQC